MSAPPRVARAAAQLDHFDFIVLDLTRVSSRIDLREADRFAHALAGLAILVSGGAIVLLGL